MNVPQHDISQIRIALAEIKDHLAALTERVGVQNGRVAKLEARADDAEALWDAHDHWTHAEKREVVDGVKSVPKILNEHHNAIIERLDFLQTRQDQILEDVKPWKLREQRLRVTRKAAEWIGADGVRLIEKAGKAAGGLMAIYGFVKLTGLG